MCNVPTFDPNDYGKVDSVDVYNDTAIFNAYEPGSVFKTITMAAALDMGKITPDTIFDDPGEVKIGPFTIRNSDLKAHGRVTMTDVLAESLNTGLVEVAHRLGTPSFLKYVRDFGFGEKTGITAQSEVGGDIGALSRKGDIWPATASFGQGLTVTVLQLASAYGAVANGGTLMKPYVVDQVRHADGRVDTTKPQAVRQVIAKRTADLLTGMLVAVVERGHGKRAGVPGYWIGGKTGTAQIPNANGPGYEAGPTIGTFAGFGPIDDPKFVMVVRIDRPKDVQFAESSAAPLFGDIAKFLMDYYRIAPTRS
jgi:cell division protein FtsI/penicillin-binding protein 2